MNNQRGEERVYFFGAGIDPLTMNQTIDRIESAIAKRQCIRHSVVNVAKLVSMQKDLELRKVVNECNLVNADGAGIVFGARLLGILIPERVTGIDIMYRLLELATRKGYHPFLLGATPDVLERTVQNLQNRHPKLQFAGYHHGYFWDHEKEVVEEIMQSKPDMLFVAISSPMKEKFLHRHSSTWNIPFTMGVGGSFDVVAGKVRRAPLWIQKIGLEWFWRMMQEPRRMWKRNLVANTSFAWMLCKSCFLGESPATFNDPL